MKENSDFHLIAEPDSTIVSFNLKDFSVYPFADAMEKRGLIIEKQSNPESIHMTMMPNHIGKTDSIIEAMKESVAELKSNPNKYDMGSKAVYGMMAKIPDEAIVEDFIVHYMDKVYKIKWMICQVNNLI